MARTVTLGTWLPAGLFSGCGIADAACAVRELDAVAEEAVSACFSGYASQPLAVAEVVHCLERLLLAGTAVAVDCESVRRIADDIVYRRLLDSGCRSLEFAAVDLAGHAVSLRVTCEGASAPFVVGASVQFRPHVRPRRLVARIGAADAQRAYSIFWLCDGRLQSGRAYLSGSIMDGGRRAFDLEIGHENISFVLAGHEAEIICSLLDYRLGATPEGSCIAK